MVRNMDVGNTHGAFDVVARGCANAKLLYIREKGKWVKTGSCFRV
jgi:hypothetical protein